MADMLDPGLEHLHRHGRIWRWTTERRQVSRELLVDLPLLVPIALLFIFAGDGSWAPPLTVAMLVVAIAIAALVRFDIGSGSASPLMLVQVPLWYAVPPAWIPVFVGVALTLSRALELRIENERGPLWSALMGAGDAWHAVGPAIAMAVAGQPTAQEGGFAVFAAAFGAAMVVDSMFSVLTPWAIHGVRPSIATRLAAWNVAVDCALAPVGFVAALMVDDAPLVVMALIPFVLVLREFARERRGRLDQAVQLSGAYRGTAQLMGDVLEADDEYTGGEHTRGVVETAIAVGCELRLSPREMRNLEFGALLHDIGKLRVPNEIINKPTGLTDEEWRVMRLHPIYGQEMLDRVGGALSDAGRVVRAHHERWDGDGYPDGLVGQEIPIAARIITACDSFSAMTTNRSYRRARSVEDALEELRRCSGSQFDPRVVRALSVVLRQHHGAPDPIDGLQSQRNALERREIQDFV